MIRVFSPVSKWLSSPWAALPALCALILNGCQSLPLSRNLPHSDQEAAHILPNTSLTMADGAHIPLRFYAPLHASPRIIILALHGFGDSRDAWETLAPSLISHHIMVVAPDLRGFGEAPSQSVSSQQHISDVLEELHWIHTQWPQCPVYLMGESMGGAIAALVASSPNITQQSSYSPPLVQGTILLAPAIMDIGQPWRSILHSWRWITPHMTLDGRAAPGHPRIATHNLAALRRLYFDPLTQHHTTIEALDTLVAIMYAASQRIHNISTPMLVITGTHDQFVPPQETAHLFLNLPSFVRRDVISGGDHLLSRDPSSAVRMDILSWITHPEKFLPSGGDIRAIEWADTILQ